MNKKRVLPILGLAAFIVMADNWVVAPLLPSISKDLGVNVASAALIIAAYMLPFGLFQLVFGYLGDKFGRIKVISTAMVFFTIATALCAITSQLTDLAVYRALTGIFAGSVMPISFALIGDIFPMNERQSAVGTFFGIAFLGQGLSMVMGGSIAYLLNWRGVFAIYAVISVVSTILLINLSRKIPTTKNADSRFFPPLIELLKNRSTRYIYTIVLFEGLFVMGAFSFFGGFIKGRFNFNDLLIGLIMSAFGLMALLGGRFAGKISAKLGQRKTVLLGLSSATLAIFTLAIGGSNLVLLIAAIGLLGFGLMLAHSTFLTIATEFSAKARGMAMSFVAFCYMCGGSIGTALGSRMIANSGFSNLFYFYALGLALMVASIATSKRAFNK
jgi:predicted MFS family arabinose efflux permease